MNSPIFLKLTGIKTNDVQFINFNLVTYFAAIPGKGTSIRTAEGLEAAKETPEQIEAALKAAGIQIIDCGSGVGEEPAEVAPTEEPKNWFRVIDEKDHCFHLGDKIQFSEPHPDSNRKAVYIKDGTPQCLFNYQVEPWTDDLPF